MAGVGLGLRSLWDIGPELKRGELKVVLPQYRGSDNVAIYAVYPCRDFMPTKVNAMIEYLSDLYGAENYWDNKLDVGPHTAGVAKPNAVRPGTATPKGQRAATASL